MIYDSWIIKRLNFRLWCPCDILNLEAPELLTKILLYSGESGWTMVPLGSPEYTKLLNKELWSLQTTNYWSRKSRTECIQISDLGTGELVGDDKSLRKVLGTNHMADNLVSAMLRHIINMQVSKSLEDRSRQLWRKILKSSFYSHLSNYLRHESKEIRSDDEKFLRQQKMLRSVLVGDLKQSIVTDQ